MYDNDSSDRLLKNWDRLASALSKTKAQREPRSASEEAQHRQQERWIGEPLNPHTEGTAGQRATRRHARPFKGISPPRRGGNSPAKDVGSRPSEKVPGPRSGNKAPDGQPDIPEFLRTAYEPDKDPHGRRPFRVQWLGGVSGPVLTLIAGVAVAGTTVAGSYYLQDVDILRVLTGTSKAPDLEIRDLRGREDLAIPFNIRASAAEGTELETLRIAGLPGGFALSHGDKVDDGGWQVPIVDLDRLGLIPPKNFHGDVTLSAKLTARDGARQETSIEHFSIVIAAVADTPDLRVADATGREDQPVSLDIFAAPTDEQESVAIVIRGLPAGAAVSAGEATAGGGWRLDPPGLDDLRLTLPVNFKGAIPLQIEVTATDADDSVLVSRSLEVSIEAVADTPTLSVKAAQGVEDQPIPLAIMAETADPAETVTIELAGLPPDARLTAGIQDSEGTWLVEPGEARGMSLLPPPNFSGVVSFVVTASASDGRDRSSTAQSLEVSVAPVADEPTLTVRDASASEDQVVPLAIAATTRDASEDISVRITGLPDGAALSSGAAQEDGSWRVAAGDLTDLSLQPPAHFSGQMELRIEATSIDAGDVATVERALRIDVAAVADKARLTGLEAAGTEDEPVALDFSATDADPSETLSVLVMDVPEDATFSQGRDNGNGTWTFVPQELEGLLFHPPRDTNGTIKLPVVATSVDGADRATATGELRIRIDPVADLVKLVVAAGSGVEDASVPLEISIDAPNNETAWVTLLGVTQGAFLTAGEPDGGQGWRLGPEELTGLELVPESNFSGIITLEAIATSTDGLDRAEQRETLVIAIAPAADDPILSASAPNGSEDTPISLSLKAEPSDPSEVVTVLVSGLPEGGQLSSGTRREDGAWSIPAKDLSRLQLTPPPEFSGLLSLQIVAVSTDGETTARVTEPLQIQVEPVADTPKLILAEATGTEDQPVPLSLGLSSSDPSEEIAVLISGLPEGARLSAGEPEAGGAWHLQAEELAGLELIPAPDDSGTFELRVIATATDGPSEASTVALMTVAIAAVAEEPAIHAADASGREDQPIALDLRASSSDPSETVRILLAGLPPGANLTSGTRLDDGRWELQAPGDLADLQLIPPPDFSGELPLELVAVSDNDGARAEASTNVTVSVAAVADPANLTVKPAAGDEDQPIALALAVEKGQREDVSLRIVGLPAGASLTAGARGDDGSWLLFQPDLEGLTLTPPPNFSGTFDLSVLATTADGDDRNVVSAAFSVVVRSIADTAELSAKNATGDEDEAIPLLISASLPDPSESLDIQVWGLPADSFLSAGQRIGAGRWAVGADALADLKFIPPLNFSGSIDLRLLAETADGIDRATVWEDLTVVVEPVADPPLVTAAPAEGREDTPIPLRIQAASADPSEELTISVTQLPDGATLTQGRSLDGGVVALTASDLGDISLLLPPHFSGDVQLAVTAASSDQGRTSSVTTPLEITIRPVADRPSLAVRDAVGIEDGIIALDIEAETPDPSERLLLRVAGLPAGSALSSGAAISETAWEVTEGFHSLSLTPPADFSGQLELQITATSIDGEATEAVDTTMRVGVVPVADRPEVVAEDVSGASGQPLPLAISVTPAGARETITLEVSGLPRDFVLSAGQTNGDGEWLLQLDDLVGLAVLPPTGQIGTISAQVRAIATDGSDRVVVETGFSIDVTAPDEQPPQQSLGLVPPANAAVQNTGSSSTTRSGAFYVAVLPPETTAPGPPTAELLPDDRQTATLIARAEQLLQIGDLAAARLLYDAAAGAGSAGAALEMGRTYDPVFLQAKGMLGARPDPGMALQWYEVARDGRHADADRLIARLRDWMDQ